MASLFAGIVFSFHFYEGVGVKPKVFRNETE
jgi:hypothetical protein